MFFFQIDRTIKVQKNTCVNKALVQYKMNLRRMKETNI